MSNISLLVYGSLINKDELKKENIDLENCIPVYVSHLKREFTQEPTYRKVDSINRAVLSVKEENESFINAILIKNVEKSHIENLDIREAGYFKYQVLTKNIKFKYAKQNIDLDEVYIYMGKDEKRNESIFPNQNYLQLCLNGARNWGEEFYKDFIKTTFVQNEALKLH